MSAEGDDALASQARKRRMERRGTTAPARKKTKAESAVLSKDVLAKIPGVKKQARYVPVSAVDANGAPQPLSMTKEELTLWRKEARRVRNRESAAASRQKTQGRITELEAQVATLTSKYQAALAHIAELEERHHGGSSTTISTSSSSHGRQDAVVTSSAWMPAKMSLDRAASATATTVSPPLSPRDSSSSSCGASSDSDSCSPPEQPLHWSLDNPQDQDAPLSSSSSLSVPLSRHSNSVDGNSNSTSSARILPPSYQQRPSKISRPNAVKISSFVDTTTRMEDATNATTVSHNTHYSNDDTGRNRRDHEGTVAPVDPLVHWSDVMPTLDLPPPPPLTAASTATTKDAELETFAQDMELLGDFLMDAMADPVPPAHHHHHHQDDEAVVDYRHYSDDSYQGAHTHHQPEHVVFDVDEELPPPPLLLPSAATTGL